MSLIDYLKKDDTLDGINIAINMLVSTLSEFMNDVMNKLDEIFNKIDSLKTTPVVNEVVEVQAVLKPPPPPPKKQEPFDLRGSIIHELQEQFKKRGKSD